MPGRSRAELFPFEQGYIAEAALRQMPGRTTSNYAASDDNDISRHFADRSTLESQNIV